MSDHLAAIDCGTNSTRLLIADADADADAGNRQVERLMEITRLGRGVDASGALAPDAIARTVDTLTRYRAAMDRHGVEQVRITATSAARDASNRDEFFDAAEAIVGARPELLTGSQEAELSFRGATAELDAAGGPFLVADIGGGSTEFAVGAAECDASNRDEFFDAAEAIVGARPELLTGSQEAELSFRGATAELDAAGGPLLVADIGGGSTEFAIGAAECDAALSLDMGCVRLTEKFLHTDPPTPYELSACLSVVDAHLDDLEREIPQVRDVRQFVGLAGTVSTVAAVEQGLATYDRDAIHHFALTRAAAEDVFRTLATETVAQRIENPGMEPQRADVIVGGCCVLVAIMRRFDFVDCLVSEADILDGLVLSLR